MFAKPTRLSSEKATKEALINALPEKHSIFHFTGHGEYNFHNPALSHLALAGEDKLTVSDICNFDLRSYKLVSLAACETAIAGNHTITTELEDEKLTEISQPIFQAADSVTKAKEIWTIIIRSLQIPMP
jgi:CHAT domain-containing protein